MKPSYNLDKIKFSVDQMTFHRAVAIYQSDGIKDFTEDDVGFRAKVRGSAGNYYEVYVSSRHYDQGYCDCYLGQNDVLCKHMVSVAICAVKSGKLLARGEEDIQDRSQFSHRQGQLGHAELLEIKAAITLAMRLIKPYKGPSRIWFDYQRSLSEGCRRLSAMVSNLPVSRQTAELLVDLLLRLDKKLSNAVDDSDGTVGDFIESVAMVLLEYVKMDSGCAGAFKKLAGRQTVFGWEEPLVEVYKKSLKK